MAYFVGARTPGITHYFPATDREQADNIARMAIRHAPGRVWIEGEHSASGRGQSSPLSFETLKAMAVAAEMEQIDPRLRLTSEEQQRRDAALTLADPVTWRKNVATMIEPILGSYANRELTGEDALALVYRISIGCWPEARMSLLGQMAFLIRCVPLRDLETGEQKLRRPRYAECIRTGTADLILSLRATSPDRLTPGAVNRAGRYDRSSPLIERAQNILKIIGWFEPAKPPAPKTIEDWVQARQHEIGQPPSMGRPRKHH